MITTNLPPQKNNVPVGKVWFPLLFGLFGYAVLNKGFAYIGYYPFFIGEFILFFYLLILPHRTLLPAFLRTTAGKIWFWFFVYNFLLFLVSATRDLNESIRNSIYWVYSIFFYIGFSYGGKLIRTKNIKGFEKLLTWISIISIFYNSLYPIRDYLQETTSFLYSGESLLGNSTTEHALLTGFIFYLLFLKKLPYRTVL